MRLLRSEEDEPPGGASLDVARLNGLTHAWYGDRLDPGWRPRDAAASQALLERAGLTGPFWALG